MGAESAGTQQLEKWIESETRVRLVKYSSLLSLNLLKIFVNTCRRFLLYDVSYALSKIFAFYVVFVP